LSASAPRPKSRVEAASDEERPPAIHPDTLSNLAQLAVIGLFIIVLLVVLRFGASLVVPMLAAVIVGALLARVGDRGTRIGVPPLLTGVGLATIVGLALFLLADALAEPLALLIERLPRIADRLSELLAQVSRPFTAMRGAAAASGDTPEVVVSPLQHVLGAVDFGVVAGFVGGLSPALGELLIFLATLMFFVVGRARMRRSVIFAFVGRERRLATLRVLNAIEASLVDYFGTAALVYVGVGTITGLIIWLSGLQAPVLWSVFTFALSFVPFFGAAIIFTALASVALLGDGAGLIAFVPAAAFLVVHLVCENLLLPAVLGRRFEINPFVVFVAIIFWTWMWGAVGAILAVPLLLIARAIRSELIGNERPQLPE
jgi:predicted PurR-regulated permease PerM